MILHRAREASITVVGEAAATAPAHRLRGATVLDPTGEALGVVVLVVRHADGGRVVVVERDLPAPLKLVLELEGGYLDADGVLHVRSRQSVQLLPTG